MSVLKNIKSLFIEDTPTEKPAENQAAAPKNPATPASTPPPMPSSGAMPPPLPATGPGTLDQRIFDSLQKALEDSNQPGFDYFEFRNSLQTLAGIIPDESTRYKSAYATAATMGLTVDKLLQSVKYYQGVLTREKDNFDKAVSQQVDLNVTAKQKDAEKLQALIQQKAEQIKKLTEEIAAHQQEMAAAQNVVAEAANRIETTKRNFYFTIDTVANQIQADAANIERYLKG